MIYDNDRTDWKNISSEGSAFNVLVPNYEIPIDLTPIDLILLMLVDYFIYA